MRRTGQRKAHASGPQAVQLRQHTPATYIRNLVAVAHAHGPGRRRGHGASGIKFVGNAAEAVDRAVGRSVRRGDGLERHEGSQRGDCRHKAPDQLHHAHGHGGPDGPRHGFDGQGGNLC